MGRPAAGRRPPGPRAAAALAAAALAAAALGLGGGRCLAVRGPATSPRPPPTAATAARRPGAAAPRAQRGGGASGRSWSQPRALRSPDASRGVFPQLCVFDLDACLWDKEMFEMMEIPSESGKVMGDLNGRGEGVVGVMSGREKISLHAGALIALQEHADGLCPGMRVALASSANTPFAERIGRTALGMLEVLPGLTVQALLLRDWDGRDVNQIGRQPPLSPNKAQTHFPRLREATGVPYDRMLFFDDCNWGDHCGMVAAACRETAGRGVVTVRTPRGLGEREWRLGLERYAAAQAVPA